MNSTSLFPSILYKLSSLVLPSEPLSTSAPTTLSAVPPFYQHGEFVSSPITLFFAPIIKLLHHHSRASKPLYELEPHIAALAAFFCRFVIITGSLTSSPDGHTSVLGSNKLELVLRLIASVSLGLMTYLRMDYDLICSVHLCSHVLPAVMNWFVNFMNKRNNVNDISNEKSKGKKAKKSNKNPSSSATTPPSLALSIGLSVILLSSLPLCLLACRLLSTTTFVTSLIKMSVPVPVKNAFHYMLPISELTASYDIVSSFVSDKELLHDMLCHLMFVTFHIQIGLGHIGIAFLTSEQRRKNMLIRMDVENTVPKKQTNGESKSGDGVGVNGVNGSEEGSTPASKFDASRKFRRSAPSFILLTVLPYMFQIILFGNLNNFAFMNVRNQIHRSVRIHELFDHDSHLTAIASESASSPEVYAEAMNTVVGTAYDIFNRKLFSLPKLILLPSIIARQPMLLMKIFPFIFATDMLKGRIVASVTDKVEELQRKARDANSIRLKVEQFDMKNAELLRRSGTGATQFTQRRWDELTMDYQALTAAGDLLRRTRGFFLWLQRNFVFVVLIDCALAKLLAEGSIVVAEIFVFSRAIEDVVDLLLIRSRSESELATLMTQVEKLQNLDGLWSKSKEARLLPCLVGNGAKRSGGIIMNNIQYTRGTASVSVEHIVIDPGIYAVTGANGSGKSTLFRILLACDTNERPIDLPESIELATPLHQGDLSDNLILPEDSCKAPDEGCEVIEKKAEMINDSKSEEIPVTSITMPSSDIVEISQTFYWPLYSKPIDWIYQKHITFDLDENEREECVHRVAEELQLLSFFAQGQDGAEMGNYSGDESKSEAGAFDGNNDTIIETLKAELQIEKEDWFSELSGGQKSKVELVRKVFLRKECPSVLLIDETFAPLDPASKSQVMAKLKEFCKKSIVLLIYHADVGRGISSDAPAGDEECIPSNSFFDQNLHVENKHLTTRPLC